MEFKNFAKALGSDLFAEILCLFLAVTLSAVGGGLFRLISCICTIAVLVCVCVNYALSRSREDQHKKRKIRLPSSCFIAVRCCCRFCCWVSLCCWREPVCCRIRGTGGISC